MVEVAGSRLLIILRMVERIPDNSVERTVFQQDHFAEEMARYSPSNADSAKFNLLAL